MEFAKLYYAMIYRIEQLTGQSDTVLHIHAGMAVLVLARVLTGRSLGTFIPFVFVVAAEVGNEVLDRLAIGSWRPAESLGDLANTLFWPLAVSLGVRWRPMIRRDRHRLDPQAAISRPGDEE